MKREFTFDITANGHLPDKGRLAVDDLIRSFAGKRVKFSIALATKSRSLNQNAYMWSAVIPPITAAFREAGNSVDDEDVHEYLKTHVGKLRQVVVTPAGEVQKIPGSTKRLTSGEMEIYLEKVRAWAAENLQIVIPLPNEH